MAELTHDLTNAWREQFEGDTNKKRLQNILSANDLLKLRVSRDATQQDDMYLFSHEVKPKVKVTDQKSSGRCWIFAALNVIRRDMIEKYSLKDNFEFSESYLFFWDKLEKLNYSMEVIWKTSNLPPDDRLVRCILLDPCSDGGQWDMFVNLINKYGLIPKSCFNESKHSSASRPMNAILQRKFRDYAMQIRKMLNSTEEDKEEKAKALKEEFNHWVYDSLCQMFGTPPKEFTWRYLDSKDNLKSMPRSTPVQFLKEFVPFDCNEYVCLIHDPREQHAFNTLYTVDNLGNIVEGRRVLYLNIPIEQMKSLTYRSLKANMAVWFGCDMGKERVDCQLDLDVNKKDLLFSTDFKMTKEDRLNYGESLMTHAMVICGCNVTNEENETIDKWKIENSWGKKEPADGFYMMTDDWFTEYVFEVVVHKKFVSDDLMEILAKNEPEVLPLWDPMGSLAK